MKWEGEISQTPRSRANRLLTALVGTSLLLSTGCSAINYTVSNIKGTLEPNDLTASTHVFVKKFELAEGLQEKDGDIGSRIRRHLSRWLWHRGYKVTLHLVEQAELDSAEPDSILIEGVITKFEFGSDAARFMRMLLLLPAALTPPPVDVLSAHAKATVRISRLAAHRVPLAEFQVEVHTNSVGGGEGHMEGLLAEAILNFINKRVDLGRPVLSAITCPTYIEQ